MLLYCADIRGLPECGAAFPGQGARERSAAGVSLLAWALGESFGISLPEIAADGHGKPFFPARPDIHFSYSHTKTHVLCALSDSPVGADIETRRDLSPAFVNKLMSPGEAEDFDFFELWTLRESFLKLRGFGDLRRDRFRRENGGVAAPEAGVFCALVGGIPGCAAAVCAYAPPAYGHVIFAPPEAVSRPSMPGGEGGAAGGK